MAEHKAEQKAEQKAGEVIDVPDPADVTRPDGSTVRVVGGRYVIEQDGAHGVHKVKKAAGDQG